MATFSDKLALLITADSTQAVSALKKVGSEAETSLSKADLQGGAFAKTLGGISTVAPVVGAGLLTLGAIAVKTALDGEAAHARLEVAITNVGQATADWDPKIKAVSDQMAQLGFNNVDVENSIAQLIPATHSVADAIQLQGLAADIARGRGESLAEATQQLASAEQGRYKSLVQAGVLSQDQVKGFKDQQDAIDALTRTYGGDASAYAGTFAGQLDKLKAESSNVAEAIGEKLIPVLNTTLSLLQDAGHQASNIIDPLKDLASHLPGGAPNAFKSAGSITADDLGSLAAAQKAYAEDIADTGTAAIQTASDHQKLLDAEQAVNAITNKLSSAQQEAANATGQVTDATQKLSAAQQSLHNDLSSNAAANLPQDRIDLAQATLAAANEEKAFSAATQAAQLDADQASGAVISLADAYQELGQSADQAAVSSFKNISDAASSSFDATQTQASAFDSLGQSLDDLTKKSGSSGAAGASKTAAAAFYDEAQKAEALRDAIQAVADDQVALTRASADQKQALLDVASAQQAYNDALHGVSSTEPGGADKKSSAKDAVGAAKDAETTAQLNVNDAQRAYNEAVKKSGKNSEEALRALLNLHDAQRQLKQSAVDLQTAQANLNGVLHGFAAGSPEVLTAAANLQTAQGKLYDSTVALREANDAVHDSTIAAGRAQDDLQGKLDKVSTAGAQGQMDDFSAKLLKVKGDAKTFATDVGANVTQATGSVALGIQAEIGALKSIVDSQPLLKGAFDTLLTNLQQELLIYLPAPNAAPVGTGTQRFARRAAGGPVNAGEPYWVGEHGPEMVVPRQSGTVIPHGRSGSTGATVYITANINNPTGNGQEIADQFVIALSGGHAVGQIKRLLGVPG